MKNEPVPQGVAVTGSLLGSGGMTKSGVGDSFTGAIDAGFQHSFGLPATGLGAANVTLSVELATSR